MCGQSEAIRNRKEIALFHELLHLLFYNKIKIYISGSKPFTSLAAHIGIFVLFNCTL
jgi:hypothetical protein